MCFPIDALPAIPPIAGAAVDVEDLVLTAADGNQFAAFVARAENPGGTGMVVLPDVRGLFRFYEELAMRFAEIGVNSVALDYFGRTSGIGKRDADFDFMPEVRKTTPEGVAADAAAAVAYLRSPEGGSCTSIYTVGFCFGGGNSFTQATKGHGLSGVVGFYGRPPVDAVDKFECKVLGLFAGVDQGIPPEKAEEFRVALEGAGVENEIVVYDGAPHSFFDRSFEEHAAASADAWARIQRFIGVAQ